MASVNKVILIGHLGRDPETRYLSNGDAMVNLSLATSEQWKDKHGEKQEKTEWHRIVLFGKTAEIAGEYLRKGSQIYIEGRLQTRKWEKDGVERYVTEIVGDRMQMLGSREQSANQPARKQASADDYQRAKDGAAKRQPGSFDDIEDDIPFMDPYRFNWRVV